jgi:prolyl 4-hydroxylase
VQDKSVSAEIAHKDALHLAEGYDRPQDWNQALDRLADSARLGHTLAQATLVALNGQWVAAHAILTGQDERGDWQALRRAIDIGAWLKTPEPRRLSNAPRVALVPEVASPELCDWLIARAREHLTPAKLYDTGTGGGKLDPSRTNRERMFPWWHRDMLFAFLRARISVACGIPVGAMEAPTILNYAPGQEFKIHHDYLDPALPGHAVNIAAHGQRVLTFLIPLNEDYEGGETDFPAVGSRFKGRKGNGLFFWNVEPNGAIDKRTMHAGLPPVTGEKWMFSQWMRDRMFGGTTARER